MGRFLFRNESFQGLDRNCLVKGCAVTCGLARVVTDPATHSGERTFLKELVQGLAVQPLVREHKEAFHVVSGRAGLAAWRVLPHETGLQVSPAPGPIPGHV
jgi:hypothetical protein